MNATQAEEALFGAEPSDDHGTRQLAFNLGSDARIAGLPKSANPYPALSNGNGGSNYTYWRMGWDHCETTWGRESRRPVRPLPLVVE